MYMLATIIELITYDKMYLLISMIFTDHIMNMTIRQFNKQNIKF